MDGASLLDPTAEIYPTGVYWTRPLHLQIGPSFWLLQLASIFLKKKDGPFLNSEIYNSYDWFLIWSIWDNHRTVITMGISLDRKLYIHILFCRRCNWISISFVFLPETEEMLIE